MDWFNPMKKVPMDKQAHTWWGWATGATLSPLLGLWALLVVFAVAYGKEWLDRKHGGEFDSVDLLATVIGGWFGVTLSMLFAYWMQ